MKPFLLPLILAAQVATYLPATAQSFQFADDDVVLGFMASKEQGSSDDVFVNLGSSISLRNNANLGVVGNIGATLADTYGSSWFSRESVRFGVFGNRDSRRNTGIGAGTAANGDPSRTVYVSRATTVPGTSLPWEGYVPDGLGSAGGAYGNTKIVIRNLTSRSDGSARMRLSELPNPNDFDNGWSGMNPESGPGFIVFAGGIVNNFKNAEGEVFVDIQRILSTNTGANPTQPVLGTGVYIATVGISSTGNIRVFKQAPATGTPFQDWVATFPALVDSSDPADREPTGDFDQDGIPNIQEFAFGGSPVSGSDNGQRQLRTVDATGDSQRDLTLTVEVRSGTTFTASGNKLTATQDGVLYTIEGSLDLVTFESAVSEVTLPGTGTPKADYVFKTFRLNASAGLNGKGFIRARAAVAP